MARIARIYFVGNAGIFQLQAPGYKLQGRQVQAHFLSICFNQVYSSLTVTQQYPCYLWHL